MRSVCALTAEAVAMRGEDTEQSIFTAAENFLFASLAGEEFAAVANEPSVLDHLEAGDYEAAYEMLYSLVQGNDMSDALFLGLAFTNYHLKYPDAAEKYAAQAAMLHGAVGDGSQTELLEAYAETLAQIAEDRRNSKMIVNESFVHLYPTQKQLEQVGAVDQYLMQGLAPAEPFITRSDRIATIGSCFTGNVSAFLRNNGYDVPILNEGYSGNLATGSFSDEVFNTYILRYLFELAFGGEAGDGDTLKVVNQHNNESTFSVSALKDTFKSASVFIITLGLAEVWFNKQTGEVYKTAKAVGDYDANIHDFRVTTVEENFDNIAYVTQAIRDNVKDASVIFTLSPVPLKATFREMGCIPANSVSKAILRVALDQLMNEFKGDAGLHYFPSYELILDCLQNPFEADRRYLGKDVVNFAMTLFANHYIVHEQ